VIAAIDGRLAVVSRVGARLVSSAQLDTLLARRSCRRSCRNHAGQTGTKRETGV
jgi:hypothetical protein